MQTHEDWMRLALQLARRGEGAVEPNPMVGCVLVRDGERIGQGWHQRFGGPHAEIEALRTVSGSPRDATAFVTLEPCCHVGKTPPCTEALIAAGITCVVVGCVDPFPRVSGGGIERLRSAGIAVEVGVLEAEARSLIAPFMTRVQRSRPWLIAKWAMTLDGRLATATGSSRWISGELSRQVVHEIRGRVDGVMIGKGTALADDPLLTARPSGLRPDTRIVLDSYAAISPQSQLVRTAHEHPLLVFTGPAADADKIAALTERGVTVLRLQRRTHAERLEDALRQLVERGMTNVLVEGGGALLGSLQDADLLDEYHVFVAPKIVGGVEAFSPVGGTGVRQMSDAWTLSDPVMERLGDDLYLHGRRARVLLD